MKDKKFNTVPLGALLEDTPRNGYSPVCPDSPTGKWVLGLSALDGHGLDLSQPKPAPANDLLVDKFILRPGDFLISRSNTFDKVGRIGVFHGGLENCSYPDLMMRFRPDCRKVNPLYLETYLRSDAAIRFIRQHATGTSGSMKKINQSIVESIPIAVPSISEQVSIATVLLDWHDAIRKTEQLVAAKSKELSCRREHLLGNSELSKKVHLGDVSTELTARNGKLHGREAIMAVTKQSGLRPMREETIAANIERYKRVPPQAFAYNPMRINIGSIAMSRFDHEVLVSPDYVVFACDQSRLIPAYLDHLRHCKAWRNHFELAGNGSVRVRIYYNDLRSFRFQLPSIEAQTRIVRLLDAASDEINLLKQQVTALKTQKRGLMQKLLTGQWRLSIQEETN